MSVIAFDVDDTLIVPAVATGLETDTPNYDVIQLYKWFQDQGNYMIIWSGGGKDYAEMWARKLGLTANEILAKDTRMKDKVDIAFDDSNIDLAKVNIKVKRINNYISRRDWNKHDELGNSCSCGCHTSIYSDAEMIKNGCDVCHELYHKKNSE